jgi:hypothetical protein
MRKFGPEKEQHIEELHFFLFAKRYWNNQIKMGEIG